MTGYFRRFARAFWVLGVLSASVAVADVNEKTYPRIDKKDNLGCVTLQDAQDMRTLERNRDKRGMKLLLRNGYCYHFRSPVEHVSILERGSLGLDPYFRVRIYVGARFYDLWFPEHDIVGNYKSVPGWSTGVFEEPAPQGEE